jgi:phosphomannomutase/phosphoglucomutase
MYLNKSIFKEYDIRGIVDKDLTSNVVKLIGFFIGKRAIQVGNDKVCVAFDIREHSPRICSYIVSGLNASGVKVYNMGMSATPVNYFANYIDGISFGATIMITASHNPKEYNGFKMTLDKKPFYGQSIKAMGKEIQSAIDNDFVISDNERSENIDVNRKYIDYMIEKFSFLKNLDKKVLLDSGNGSAGFLIDEIYESIGIEFEHLFKEPDGSFPNHHPDPSNSENLKDIYSHIDRFDLAFAFDGDGDRLATITNKYNIKGDMLALIFARTMDNPIVVAEVKSSKVMYEQINKIGTAIMCKTGHSNIKEKIQEVGASFGAEVSGHIFFNDKYFGFDDALYASLRVLELIYQGIELDMAMDSIPQMYSTDELLIEVKEEEKFNIIKNIAQDINNSKIFLPKILNIIDIDGLRIEFENGWGLVRASNTTPMLVTRFEADTQEYVNIYQNAINAIIKEYKG